MSTQPDLHDPPRLPLTRTLYVGPEIVVTWNWLLVNGQRYDVADLSGASRSRGPLHPGAYSALFIAAVDALLFVPIVLLAGMDAAVVAGSGAVVFAAAAAVIAPCFVAWVCVQRWPRRRELWARYRGAHVCLFTSRDEREFGRVSRAVQRAIEATPRNWP